MAVFLVVAGLAVPHLDDELLSTMLFLAGTGLAAVLLWGPWQLAHTNPAVREAYQPTTRARAANKADKVAQI